MATFNTNLVAIATVLLASLPALAGDPTTHMDLSDPSPSAADGKGTVTIEITHKVNGETKKSTVKIDVDTKDPKKNSTAAAKAQSIVDGFNNGGDEKNAPAQKAKVSGNGTGHGTNATTSRIEFPGSSKGGVVSVKRTGDTTGEKDWFGDGFGTYTQLAYDMRLDLDRSAVASGVALDGGPSTLVFGVDPLFVSTILILPGMTGQAVLDALYADLTTNPASPAALRQAVTFGAGGVQVFMGETLQGADETWFGGGLNDSNLAAGATWENGSRTDVPGPGSMALLGLGGVIAARRHRRA